ncbi:MAG: DMT family transporter [Actinomycetota bacterium]|nr:DMT family transporter [Actinomycetota bacterium]
MAAAVIAALAAAAFFAAGSALQHRSAGAIPAFTGFGLRGISRFAWDTLRHPSWVAGSLADIVGLGLHAFALNQGPLTLVQPVLVTGVIFALPMRAGLDRRSPGRNEMVLATVLVAGLILFLVAATPGSPAKSPADHTPVVVTVVAVAVAVALCAVFGRRLRGSMSAAVLGVGAGISFAGTAAALKGTTDALSQGFVAVLTSPPLYLLVAAGAVGLALNQLAFAAGPLRASLPAITTLDPLASLVIGVVVYDEHLRNSSPAVAGTALGLAVVVVTTLALTRSEAGGPSEPD